MWSSEKYIFLFSILLILIKHAYLQKQSQKDTEYPSVYNIGGVLSGNESETYFATTISVCLLVVFLIPLFFCINIIIKSIILVLFVNNLMKCFTYQHQFIVFLCNLYLTALKFQSRICTKGYHLL